MKESLKNFLPLKEYFARNSRALIVGLFSLLAVDFLQLLIPMVIKRAIDALTLGEATSTLLLQLGAVIVAIALAMASLRYVWRHCLFGLSRKIEEGIRNRLYEHLQTLSVSFYHRTKTGDLMARAINDINAVRMATGMGLVALTDGVVLGVSAIGFMLYIDPSLTFISVLPAPLLVFVTRILTRRMSSGYEKVQATFSDLTECAREAFAGIRVIKAYAREPWTYRKLKKEGETYIRENIRLTKTIGFFSAVMVIFTNLGLAIVLWFGGRLTILGHITTGDFVAFISYLTLLMWPMMAIGWVTNMMQRGAASMRRLNRVFHEVPEIKDAAALEKGGLLQGRIEFRGAVVTYPGAGEPAVKNIHFTIEAGQTAAFVGKVGCGKSTLLQVVPRLFNVARGTVFIDGRDLQDIPLKRLRQSIGFVTQEVFIFSDTIRNNVLFGREGVSEETLVRALRTAEVYEEITALDQGLDSLLGERGITLSGGQRQRLSIARAVLTDPPILILDDALSMVDTRTEERILNQVLSSRKGKTNLIVSHRVSTISRADIIAVLVDGEIVETGDHPSLLSKGNEYARLYERQRLEQELELESRNNGQREKG